MRLEREALRTQAVEPVALSWTPGIADGRMGDDLAQRQAALSNLAVFYTRCRSR